MKCEIGYGMKSQTLEVPDQNLAGVLLPNQAAIERRGLEEISWALDHPIASPHLEKLVKPGQKVAIITSDITRPIPSALVLPPVLKRLTLAGVEDQDITIVFALGSHRQHTPAEMEKMAGPEVYRRIRCVDSTASGFISMGVTGGGTPVDICADVAQADFRICLANIEYHYFVGYSGGVKTIMPGVSTRMAIQANHSRMTEPMAVAGQLDNNPVRRDIEEAAGFCPVHFLLNVVLDEHKEIIRAVAGHAVKAHREGCRFLDQLYLKEIKSKADIVVASQGGFPKDLNLYQTQKALDNAKHAVRKGGIIILVGTCHEGMGEGVFETWMTGAPNPEYLIKRIQEDFQLGGHKAAAIAMVLEDANIYLVSQMEPDFVRSIFMTPFSHVQEALTAAMEKLGSDAKVLLMPYGGSTLPVLCGNL